MRLDLDLSTLPDLVSLDQYFGLWAVEERRFMAMWEQVQKMDLAAHVAAQASTTFADASIADDPESHGLRVIDIIGTITKRGSSLSSAGSTIRIGRAVRDAAGDPSVKAILLRLDTPGGTIAGLYDLTQEILRARQKKRVWALCDDFCASAGYWIAASCDKIFANNKTAEIGSIGTFVGLYDSSEYAKRQGIRAIVIRAGKYKGAGFPGTEITEEQISEWQTLVDQTQEVFTAAVAAGRGMSIEQASNLADGRCHLAEAAKKLGLIDGIGSFEGVARRLIEASRNPLEREAISMPPIGRRLEDPENDPEAEDPEYDPEAEGDPEDPEAEDPETDPEAEGNPEDPEAEGDPEDPEAEDPEEQPAAKSGKRASIKQLRKACPGASSDFLLAQVEKGATVASAQAAWCKRQAATIKKLKANGKTGCRPLGTRSGGGSAAMSARERFEGIVQQRMDRVIKHIHADDEHVHADKVRKKRMEIIQQVAREYPNTHRAYLLARNQGVKQQRLIMEKYDMRQRR